MNLQILLTHKWLPLDKDRTTTAFLKGGLRGFFALETLLTIFALIQRVFNFGNYYYSQINNSKFDLGLKAALSFARRFLKGMQISLWD